MAALDTRQTKIRAGVALILVALIWSVRFVSSSESGQATAQERSSTSIPWQPNQASHDAQYAGTDKCLTCHSGKATQPASHMAKALELADDCRVLRTQPLLTFRQGTYSYRIVREKDRSIYTVSDGSSSFTAAILYCFGQGEAGQTYVFEDEGSFYESRVSFYKEIQGLDITLGHARGVPGSLKEAAGNRMTPEAARNCFGCHSTAAAGKAELQLERLIPGITCESCHGPGAKHVAAVAAGDLKEKRIFNPAALDTEGISTFCGSCHRTWEDVAAMILARRKKNQELGINSVRFQPYRIANSLCYDADDRRISCTACHDPHKDREHNPAFYDARCTACHSSASKEGRVAKTCPVGKQKCVTCHMPKYDLPGSHFKFTDHHIRVVRPHESVW